jgi:Tol biopolymer transport system component
VMDADGTDLRPLVVNGAYNISASWSPDGTQIAFASSSEDGSRSIYVLEVDSGEVNLIRDNGSSPDWSPDGTQIAFIRDDDLYVMRADGQFVDRLVNDEGQAYYPDWSPDGTQILFASLDPESGPPETLYNVKVITLETGEVTLIKAGLDANNVGWSRDGTKILFDADLDINTEIYVMKADGTDERRLTNDEASDYYATWSPALPED